MLLSERRGLEDLSQDCVQNSELANLSRMGISDCGFVTFCLSLLVELGQQRSLEADAQTDHFDEFVEPRTASL